MRETRSTIVLSRIAKKLRKETGDESIRTKSEVERPKLRDLILMSMTRPIRQSLLNGHWGNQVMLTLKCSAAFHRTRRWKLQREWSFSHRGNVIVWLMFIPRP